MTNKRLTVLIEGRKALPVRAIPFVTGWTLSPDEVAKHLSRKVGPPFAQLRNLSAYHQHVGTPVRVLPKEWDAVVARLAAFEAKLRSKFPNAEDDDQYQQGYAAWRDKAASKLPAGVFVWLDEFEREFREDFSPEKFTYTNERPGERALVLTPMLPGRMRETVLEGFEEDAEHEPANGEAEPAPPALENWMMRIQAQAATLWRHYRQMSCNPTKLGIKDELARWSRENDVKTKTGINPSPDYIYRHVLRKWTPPKGE